MVVCRLKERVVGVARQLPAINHQVRWGTPLHFRFRPKHQKATRVFDFYFMFLSKCVTGRLVVGHSDAKYSDVFHKTHFDIEKKAQCFVLFF